MADLGNFDSGYGVLSPLDFVFWGLEIAEPHSLDLALCFDDAALLRAAPVVLVASMVASCFSYLLYFPFPFPFF